MFRRHCVLYHHLINNPSVEYLLVLDADMGIINPNHLIEDYINQDIDLLFYNRLYAYEIMAGSFIVKNTKFTQNFLRFWFEYELKLPRSFHGTDNGAIQMVFLDLFCGNCSNVLRNVCWKLWEKSE